MRRLNVSIRLIALLLVLPATATAVDAQDRGFRQLSLSRGPEGIDTLHAHVEFTGGELRVLPSQQPTLYAAELQYDAERARPVSRFDRARGVLEIGTRMGPISRGLGLRGVRHGSDDEPVSTLELRLGQDTPTELSVDVTAAGARIELGGVPLYRLDVRTSAAEGTLSFASSNPSRMSLLTLTARGASLQVAGIANANAERISAHATAAQIELDLDGAWDRSVTIDARVTLGEIILRVPHDAGVRILARERLWGSIEGLPRAGRGEYLSPNWESATRRIVVEGAATAGSIRIVRAR